MLDIDFQFIWVGVNLLVLYLVLRKILFGRVGSFIDSRAAAILADIAAGEKAREDGEASRLRYESMLGDAKTEVKAIVDEARARAEREYELRMTEAKAHAQAIVDKAREDVERERLEAFAQVRGSVASLAILAASRVMESNMDTESNRALVKSFLDSQEAA